MDAGSIPAVSFANVIEAQRVLRGAVRRTPVFRSRTLDRLTGRECYLKCENFQCTGSFKFRGAYHLLSRLTVDERKRGILTVSSGNLAQAVALAAKLTGTRAAVCMPLDASPVKLAATRDYGAEVLFYDRRRQNRIHFGQRMAQRRGMGWMPNDHPAVLAGAGTAALELIGEVPGLDAIVAPVSSGGLTAGTCIAVRGLQPSIRVYGVEPEGAEDTRLSLAKGRRIRIPPPGTAADGLRADIPGQFSFPVNLRYLTDILTVSDESILAAVRFSAMRLKLVVEPSGAAALAALLNEKVPRSHSRIGVILSGGNVDPSLFGRLWK